MSTAAFRRLLASALLLLASPTVAESSFCNEKDIAIYFGNGMFNDQVSAMTGAVTFARKLSAVLPEDEFHPSWHWSYNQSESLDVQLLEVMRQKGNDQAQSFWRWVAGGKNTPQWFKDRFLQLATAHSSVEYIVDVDLRAHVAEYRAHISEGRRVMLVAHSQGNLYANLAYDLVGSESFGIVSVATPASTVKGGGPYLTLDDDAVMNFVRNTTPSTLRSNLDNRYAPVFDWSHHSWTNEYLGVSESGADILDMVFLEMSELEG